MIILLEGRGKIGKGCLLSQEICAVPSKMERVWHFFSSFMPLSLSLGTVSQFKRLADVSAIVHVLLSIYRLSFNALEVYMVEQLGFIFKPILTS